MTTLTEIRKALRGLADPAKAAGFQRFFKTGPGEYGEGDRFLGLTVPQVRSLVRRFHPADPAILSGLLRSPFHEERLLGLLLLVERHRRGTERDRDAAHRLYGQRFPPANNPDLAET